MPVARAVKPNSLARHAPQRIVRTAEVCDRCHSVNPFRNRCTIRRADGSLLTYASCKTCGRNATRIVIVKKG